MKEQKDNHDSDQKTTKDKITLPPLKIQEQIVAKIEAEQKAIEECKKLIATYEQKIFSTINEVWQTKSKP